MPGLWSDDAARCRARCRPLGLHLSWQGVERFFKKILVSQFIRGNPNSRKGLEFPRMSFRETKAVWAVHVLSKLSIFQKSNRAEATFTPGQSLRRHRCRKQTVTNFRRVAKVGQGYVGLQVIEGLQEWRRDLRSHANLAARHLGQLRFSEVKRFILRGSATYQRLTTCLFQAHQAKIQPQLWVPKPFEP